MNVNQDIVDVRFTVGLPAQGRKVLGQWTHAMLVTNLPEYIREGILYSQQVEISQNA